MVSQDGSAVLAQRRHDIGIDGMGVLWHLIGVLDFQNLIQISPTEIGRVLGMQRPNVSRAIKRLVNVGVLIEGTKVGAYRSYRFNPEFG